MSRNMSFAKTTAQVRTGRKTVTRRLGWWFLKPGDIVNAVEKCRGLKKGEKVKHIRQIRIVSTNLEAIGVLSIIPRYGAAEVEKEGFAHDPLIKTPEDFVAFFCAMNKCEKQTKVNRIEFEYFGDASELSNREAGSVALTDPAAIPGNPRKLHKSSYVKERKSNGKRRAG